MTYLALVFWLLMIIFLGIGLHGLLSRLLKPAWLSWALLPGTIVSEMAYIFGSLITGGEVRSKLLPGGGKKGSSAEGATDATHGSKFVGPMIASLLAIVACGAALLVVHGMLGGPVTGHISLLRQELPDGWNDFWDQARYQLTLTQQMFESLGSLRWSDWRVPVFVYLTVCLALRLAPARRPMRPTLAATILMAAGVAMAGALSSRFADLMSDVWPLVSYVWTMLLVLLSITLLSAGLAALIRVLSGHGARSALSK